MLSFICCRGWIRTIAARVSPRRSTPELHGFRIFYFFYLLLHKM